MLMGSVWGTVLGVLSFWRKVGDQTDCSHD